MALFDDFDRVLDSAKKENACETASLPATETLTQGSGTSQPGQTPGSTLTQGGFLPHNDSQNSAENSAEPIKQPLEKDNKEVKKGESKVKQARKSHKFRLPPEDEPPKEEESSESVTDEGPVRKRRVSTVKKQKKKPTKPRNESDSSETDEGPVRRRASIPLKVPSSSSKSGKSKRRKAEKQVKVKKEVKIKKEAPVPKSESKDKGKQPEVPKRDIFHGAQFCLLGIPAIERPLVSLRINEEGGKVVEVPDESTMFVIATNSTEVHCGIAEKLRMGKLQSDELKVPVVRHEWLANCLTFGSMVDHEGYLLSTAKAKVTDEKDAKGAEAIETDDHELASVPPSDVEMRDVEENDHSSDDPYSSDDYLSGDSVPGAGPTWTMSERIFGPKFQPHSRPLRAAAQDSFLCMKPSPMKSRSDKGGPNDDIIAELQAIQKHMEAAPLDSKDPFRAIQYRRAITKLRKFPRRVDEEALKELKIGPRIAAKIDQFLDLGMTDRLRGLEDDLMQRTVELFSKVHGCGAKVALLWFQRGFRTLDDVRRRPDLLSRQQKIGLELFDDFQERIPREEITKFLDLIKEFALEVDPKLEVRPQGSYRRGAPDSGDFDMIVTHPIEDVRLKRSRQLVAVLKKEGLITHDLYFDNHEDNHADFGDLFIGVSKLPQEAFDELPEELRKDGKRPLHRRMDMMFVKYETLGAALLHFTGNDIFNRSLRALAKRKGFTLSQNGLYEAFRHGVKKGDPAKKGRLVAAATELDIFEALGVPYRPPSERNVNSNIYVD